MMIELRHIRYVIAVAEERHITRAAERLGIQQPPLSRQIQTIERELNVQLFRRRPRGVELTEAGRAFLDGARRLVSSLNETLDTTRRTARGEQGRLCVGLTPTAPFHPLVPRVIRAFRDAFPMVSITLQESLSGELVERMRDEQMDIAFLRTAVADPQNLAIYPLLDEPMVVALPSSHPLAQASERGIALKQLAGETFILYGPPGSGIYDRTLAACSAAGFNPRVGQQAPRITSTLSLIATGVGISLVPASLQRMSMDGLTYRRIRGAIQPKAILSLAYRRTDSSAAVRQLVTLTKRAAKNGDGAEGK